MRTLKVVVLYPLIPSEELSLLTDIVCNTNHNDVHFTALITESDFSGFPTRCFRDVIRTSIFDDPARFQHITNSHIARKESLFQNEGHNSYVDSIAATVEHADMVWTGPDPPLYEHFKFIDYVIEMIPLPPQVISFSRALINGISNDVNFSQLFSHIIQSTGFLKYSKEYRFDVAATMQCVNNKPSHSCRGMLPPEMNDLVDQLATNVHRSAAHGRNEHNSVEGPKCYEKFPGILGAEGVEVLNAIRRHRFINSSEHETSSSASSSSETTSPRVMCFTYSYEVKHDYVEAIRKTWGKRCDGYLAISNISLHDQGIVALGPLDEEEAHKEWFQQDSYNRMWTKTQLIFNLIATSSLLDDYDFFLLGGDDLYVLVDNLKTFLASERIQAMSDQPLYIGREIWANNFTRFNSGGAGYVLNRAAALVLYRLVHHPNGNCLPSALSPMEDLFVGKCFSEVRMSTHEWL